MIRAFFDLSLRYKIPIWGSALILSAAASVAAALMVRTHVDQRETLYQGAEGLARHLAHTLSEPLLDDDVWQAFEIVRSAASADEPTRAGLPDLVIVLDQELAVYVSTRPTEFRMLTPARFVSGPLKEIAERIGTLHGDDSKSVRFGDGSHLYVATAVLAGDAALGYVVLAYSRAGLAQTFLTSAWNAAAITSLVLLLLLPANLYWTRHTVKPVLMLADRMSRIGRGAPPDLDHGVYPYRDEIGQLFDAYERMHDQLARKDLLESEAIKSERLASLGRLTAGIAHEINNPLAGLLTAASTLKIQVGDDARALRSIHLIERGLLQIRDTVATLLVQARPSQRDLTPEDIEDLRTLLDPLLRKKVLRLAWNNRLSQAVPIQAGLFRQVLMNLMTNAIRAVSDRGKVEVDVDLSAGGDLLRLAVVDDGPGLAPEVREHLFEPFVSAGGTGLGLWVTYQIVQQMHGQIEVHRELGMTRFEVRLPLAARAA